MLTSAEGGITLAVPDRVGGGKKSCWRIFEPSHIISLRVRVCYRVTINPLHDCSSF